MLPIIHVVTPCMNTRDTIDRTILSVITQVGDFRLRYHVQDGGSTDGNWERVQWWQDQVNTGRFPIQCAGITFTSTREGDVGMYDAIIKGYDQMRIPGDAFLTWINADDILTPGSAAFAAAVWRQFEVGQVSWFGGGAHLAREEDYWSLVNFDRPIPTEAARAGMCDSLHWQFVQQEGTYYRKWLWDAVDPGRSIRTMKVAGDWNLWRLMAHHATLVQATFPLGCFTVREGQLSRKYRDTYHSEMDERASPDARRAVLAEMGARGHAVRRKFQSTYATGQLTVLDERFDWLLTEHHKKVFGAPPKTPFRNHGSTVVHVGNIERVPRLHAVFQPQAALRKKRAVVGYDSNWQVPAITEKQAFDRMLALDPAPQGVLYVGFPWATLIDKRECDAPDTDAHEELLRRFAARLPQDAVKVTVCQHIYMRRHMDLFRQAGIAHIFWSHATADLAGRGPATPDQPMIHPFPLYPAQVPQARPGQGPEADALPRRYLYSFIGARAGEFYPRQTRNWIIDDLAADPRGLITGREGWYYHQAVYDGQIRGDGRNVNAFLDLDQEEQFRLALDQSTFALCPAGTGPNSIRLWEAIGAGAIPVILADNWAPPGDARLWQAAAVFCPEDRDALRALPDRLAALAADAAALAAMRQALRQLWLLYGPDNFVHDIHRLMQRLAAGAAAAPAAPQEVMSADDAHQILLATAGRLLVEPELRSHVAASLQDKASPIRRAFHMVPGKSRIRKHFSSVLAQAKEPLSVPAIGHGFAPRLCFLGRHSHRAVLGYAPFSRLIDGRVFVTPNPTEADLIVTGFNRDIRDDAQTIADAMAQNPDLRVAVLSEEPLWDIHWSDGFTEPQRQMSVNDWKIPYAVLNHETTGIFAFEHLPYFPLTEDDFPAIYAARLQAQAARSAADILEGWRSAPIRQAFFAEFRQGAEYRVSLPERHIWGLCEFRSLVARAAGEGTLRVGRGWRDQPLRQSLPNWHFDKLATLTGRTRILSAIENTHHRHYISEKLFDAFAVGAIPIYHASPLHRARQLVPAAAMINSFGMSAEAVARLVINFEPDMAMAEAWRETADRLAQRFADTDAIQRERQRITDASIEGLLALC